MTGTVGGQQRAQEGAATGQQMTGTTQRTTAQAGSRAADQHRASKIIGMDVVNRQGEKLGDVEDIIVDQRGNVTHAVVSTGGFLGIGERLHAIPWDSINRDGAGQNFVVDVDRDRLRNAPGFDRNNWPNVTDQQWRQQNQRFFQAGTDAGTTGTAAGQRDTTTGMQRGTTGQTGATGTTGTTGATDQQTGTKPYGTDVDRDRMRQGTTGTTGQQGTTGATDQQTGTKPYGTDVDRDRMRQGTTGTTGTTGRPVPALRAQLERPEQRAPEQRARAALGLHAKGCAGGI
jgi:sporulation protein YlmC with PRC-barrel domain